MENEGGDWHIVAVKRRVLGEVPHREADVRLHEVHTRDIGELDGDHVPAGTGTELEDEDYTGVVDHVLLWWRDGDGDLTDALVDAMTALDDSGPIWVLTPKAGRPGHVPPSEIAEAATTCGLHAMSTFAVAPDWSATRTSSRGRGK